MPTLDEIKTQINNLPHKYIFYTKKEIKYLPEIMADDEQVLALTSGFMNNTTWLCVCTNRRVIFLDKGMIYGLRQIQMNLDRIQSIDSEHGLVFGSIRVWDGASAMVVKMILKESIGPFVQAVRDAIHNYRRWMYQDMQQHTQGAPAGAPAGGPAPAPATQAGGAVDIASQIERLAKLKDSGHLTEEEFQAQKTKLLNS